MSAPMSMEEWQNRLRAQKQQDRNNKNKSAEMLHSYQAKDEDERQKRLRESRRESLEAKKEAEKLLHNYRPDAETLEAMTPKVNQSTSKYEYDGPPPDVTAPSKDDPRNAILEGSVSSIAANFTGPSTLTTPEMSPSKAMKQRVESNSANASPSEPTTEHIGSSVESLSASFTEVGSTHTTSTTQDWVQVTSEEFPGSDAQNTQMVDVRDVKDESRNDIPSHVENVMDTQMLQPPTTDTPMADTNDMPSLVSETELSQPNTNAAETTTMDEGPFIMAEQNPQYQRLDVDFSFGLISTRAQPSMDAYMEACLEVVLGALEENYEMKERLTFNSECPPFVQNIRKDDSYVDSDGRSNVQRLLVKAAVPVFLTKGISAKKARSFVIKALAAALRQGYFLRIADTA